MGNITEKQKKVIVSLENELGIKFTGKTKREAWLWMNKHMKPSSSSTEITDKQWMNIKKIEDGLDIRFEGATKREAWEWMQEYIPKYRQLLMDMVEQFKERQELSATSGSILRFDSYSNPTLEVLDHIDYMDSIPTKTIDSLNQEVNYYMSLMERW